MLKENKESTLTTKKQVHQQCLFWHSCSHVLLMQLKSMTLQQSTSLVYFYAELLAKIDRETYQKYVYNNQGQSTVYMKLKKALCGTMKAAILIWKKLSKSLKGYGFTINPCDWCVDNMMVDGEQCTILRYVDDLKISHKDAKTVSDIIEKLKADDGKVGKLTVKR